MGVKEEPSFEPERGTRIAKVMVDLVVFPAFPNPVIRVRGLTLDQETAFTITCSSEASAKVRDILSSGEYVDDGFSGIRYVWEADAIEYSEDVRETLGLPYKSVEGPRVPESKKSTRRAGPEDFASDTVAGTNEVLFGPPKRREAEVVEETPPAPTPPAAPAPSEEAETVAGAARSEAAERVPTKAQVPRRARPTKPKKKAVQTVTEEAAVHPAERDEVLLVSKSWYIQEGDQNKKEAIRISKVLRDFRWKVEPVYTIGVILDDMLSVVTNKEQISRKLIMRIEDAGYRLTAVTVDQGSPVAWFKRAAPKTRPRTRPADAPHAESAELSEPAASDNDDLTEPDSDVVESPGNPSL